MADRELLVRILGDDRQLQQTFARTGRSTEQLQKKTSSIGAGLKAGFAAAGVVVGGQQLIQGIGAAVEAASNLNEQISKSRQVFGQASPEVEAWARQTASSIGIANDRALEATGTFGNLFRTVGIAGNEASGMSIRLVQLAADLASFNNASPADTLEAIRSGLIGEAEPLRRYGVLLSETRVQQQALADTGKTTTKSLTDQEKAVARYEIILRDTVPAQGDFARTSEGLANQQRIAAAQIRDLAASIGEKLIPALTTATTDTNLLIGAIERLSHTKIHIPGTEKGGSLDFLDEKIRGIFGDRFGRDLSLNVLFPGLGFSLNTWQLLDAAIKAVATDVEAVNRAGGLSPENAAGPRGPGAVSATNRAVEAGQADAAARDANRALADSRKRYSAFVSGLGLKLKNAGLTTEDFGDDLAVLQEIERAIIRQIAREGRTFKLANDLADVRGRIATVTAQIAQQSADKTRTAFAAIIASLDLRLDRAALTTKLDDDVAALEALNAAIAKEIRIEGRTAELLSQQQEARQRLAAAKRGQTQQQQFSALGLSPEGAARIPGVGALRRRGANLSEQIKGTALDTPKTRSQLRNIARVLAGDFGKVGDEVRSAILAMFNKISSALQQGSKSTGKTQQTAFRVVNTSEVLGGLGLSVEETQKLRRRLSRLGPGGTTPQAGGAGGAFGFAVGAPGGGTVINGNVTVIANDPAEFGRQLQKKGRRTTHGRSGPHAGQPL